MNCHGDNHYQSKPDNGENNPDIVSKPSGISKNLIWLILIGVMLAAIWKLAPGLGAKASLLPLIGMMLCPLIMGMMMHTNQKQGNCHSTADNQNQSHKS